MIDRQQLFKLSPDVLSQNIDDETILLDMKSENYFGINEVGRRVLEILKDGASINTILEQLLDEYEVEKDILEKDIPILLQQLLEAKIIHS